jgi:hypothetical protein
VLSERTPDSFSAGIDSLSRLPMPLWFELAVLVLLAAMVLKLSVIEHNIANLGIRLETVMLDRLEQILRQRNSRTNLSDD